MDFNYIMDTTSVKDLNILLKHIPVVLMGHEEKSFQ